MFQNILESIQNRITGWSDEAITRQEKKLGRRINGQVILVVGVLFFAYAAAVFLNQSLRVGDWPGFVIIGFILVLVGARIKKSVD